MVVVVILMVVTHDDRDYDRDDYEVGDGTPSAHLFWVPRPKMVVVLHSPSPLALFKSQLAIFCKRR